MKNQHKYFRNLRYKQKLEKKFFERSRKFYGQIRAESEEPITNQSYNLFEFGMLWSVEDYGRVRGKSRYVYYDLDCKPDVEYTIIKSHKKYRFFKETRISNNRRFRHNNKEWISSHRGDYRKFYEYDWLVD